MPSPTEVIPRFSGKTALITGAGSGVGRATSVRLSREGAQVMGFDIDGDGLKGTADLVAEAGSTMHVRQGDVSVPAECKAAVSEAVQAMGQLDAGFVLTAMYEDRWPESPLARHLATFMATRAVKPRD